jgi:hypothetical protein
MCCLLPSGLQAVCQLSHPSPRWLLTWQEAVVGKLKGLGVRELCTAAEVMLLHDVQPSKPWAALWCVAMEVRGWGGGGWGG